MENYLKNKLPTEIPKVRGKNSKPYKFSHTSGSQKGLGDYYGTGIVAKLGRMRDDSMGMHAISPKKLSTPPKSLA